MRPRSGRPARLLRCLGAGAGLVALAIGLQLGGSPSGAMDFSRLSATAPGRAAQAPAQWCGTDRVATDRPDVVGGNQVHVVYAVPADGVDQFGVFASRIVTDLAAIDAWWRRQDPSRVPRLDLASFPGCATPVGQTDLSFVRLPRPTSSYLTLGSNLSVLTTDLGASGLTLRTKRYLVYYDGPTNDLDVCGTAFRDPTGTGGGEFVAAVWMRSCGGDLGSGDYLAAVAAHEVLHTLGALPAGALHPCRGDSGHPCDSPQDVMYPNLSDHFANLVLDVNRDDYYGHSGAWLDVQDSRWLARADVPPVPLTVAVRQRAGEDRVLSDPAGIGCPGACGVVFDAGTQVRLAASAADGSRFLGWTGACAGAELTCTVTMDAAKTVEATFGPSTFGLTLLVTGKGRAAAPTVALSCARRCSAPVEGGAVLRIRAFPTKGWRFARWTGACRGRGTCSVRLSEARVVGTVFERVPVPVTVKKKARKKG